jgi:hypothetical protein
MHNPRVTRLDYFFCYKESVSQWYSKQMMTNRSIKTEGVFSVF